MVRLSDLFQISVSWITFPLKVFFFKLIVFFIGINCAWNFSKIFEDIRVLVGGMFLMKTDKGAAETGQGGFCL